MIMKKPRRWSCCAAVAVLCWVPEAAMARVKLITLPVRERVKIQLDNPNATLVLKAFARIRLIVPFVRYGKRCKPQSIRY